MLRNLFEVWQDNKFYLFLPRSKLEYFTLILKSLAMTTFKNYLPCCKEQLLLSDWVNFQYNTDTDTDTFE